MARFQNKWVLAIVGFLLAGMMILEGYGIFHFKDERDALQETVTKLGDKGALLEKKYAEEKARAAGMLRAKATLEGRASSLQAEFDKLRKENAALASQTQMAGSEIQKKTQFLETKVEELSGQLNQARQECDALKRESAQTIQELDGKVTQLGADNRSLASELKQERQEKERCKADNGKLAGIVDELMEKYEKKGVVGSILQNEPFTQLEKVEAEKMLQEYRDVKSQHTIVPSENQQPQ